MEKKELASIISNVLVPQGFKRKGNYWVINGQELNKVVDLQKSEFSNRFYVNYGFIINAIPLVGWKKHIFYRLGSKIKKDQKRITELLDLDNDISDESRAKELGKFINENIITKLLSVNTEEDILKYLKNQPDLLVLPVEVKKYFNLINQKSKSKEITPRTTSLNFSRIFDSIFRSFKRKNRCKIQKWEFDLLQAVAESLPNKYSFIKKQVTPDFILNSLPNEFLNEDWKTLVYNQNLIDTFKDNKRDFVISGIQLYDKDSKSHKSIDLDIANGILIGYGIRGGKGNFDLLKIKTNQIKESNFVNPDKEELVSILGVFSEKLKSYINIENTFLIEVPEGKYYVIRDFGNGNYLGVDKKGSVFSLIHDPYEIEKLFDDKEGFYKALESGYFDMDRYYENKFA